MMKSKLQISYPQAAQLCHDRLMIFISNALIVVTPLLVLVLAISVWLIVQAPNDYQHGATGKILYLHVPSAWLATLCYTWMVMCALVAIFKPVSRARLFLATAAPLGAIFTALTLITGSLWGRAAWGAWWVWDARLTSVFILFLLYLTIIFLDNLRHRMQKSENMVAVLTLFGFVVVPIIKFSARWWHALHQPTSLWRSEGPAIEMAMLIPLIIMALAFTLLFIVLYLLALRAKLLCQHLHALQLLSPTQIAQHVPQRLSFPILSRQRRHPKLPLIVP